MKTKQLMAGTHEFDYAIEHRGFGPCKFNVVIVVQPESVQVKVTGRSPHPVSNNFEDIASELRRSFLSQTDPRKIHWTDVYHEEFATVTKAICMDVTKDSNGVVVYSDYQATSEERKNRQH